MMTLTPSHFSASALYWTSITLTLFINVRRCVNIRHTSDLVWFLAVCRLRRRVAFHLWPFRALDSAFCRRLLSNRSLSFSDDCLLPSLAVFGMTRIQKIVLASEHFLIEKSCLFFAFFWNQGLGCSLDGSWGSMDKHGGCLYADNVWPCLVCPDLQYNYLGQSGGTTCKGGSPRVLPSEMMCEYFLSRCNCPFSRHSIFFEFWAARLRWSWDHDNFLRTSR